MNKQEKLFVEKFGENLKQIRMSKGLSQEMLANDANIPINQIGRIERAEISTSLTTIYKIMIALEVKINDLFNFD